MPLLTTASTTTYYRFDGGDGLPVLMLSHSLGQDHSMWDAQTSALSSRFRILRYDTRGHGASAVPAGDYRIEQLADDALALADALGIRTFAFCGLSLGGMVGSGSAPTPPIASPASCLPTPRRAPTRRAWKNAGSWCCATA